MGKICPDCNEVKAFDQFWKNSRSIDGLQTYCIPCLRIRRKKSYSRHRSRLLRERRDRYAQDPEKRLTYNKTYRAQNLGRAKMWSRKYYMKNRAAILEKNKQWYAENPEKKLEKNRRRRAAKSASPGITDDEWEMVLERFNHECLCCHTTDDITMDHVIPLSKGGIDHISNVQPLCRPCNAKKGATTADYRR